MVQEKCKGISVWKMSKFAELRIGKYISFVDKSQSKKNRII